MFDSWDPANVSPMIAYLGSSVCPFTGEVFFVQGDVVCRYQPYSIAERITINGQRWTVERLIEEGPKLTPSGDRRGGPGELAREHRACPDRAPDLWRSTVDLVDILPSELLFVFGVPLLVAVILVLVAGRTDADLARRARRLVTSPRSVSCRCSSPCSPRSAPCGATDLIVDKESSSQAANVPEQLEDIFDSLPDGQQIFDLPGGGGNDLANDDADYRLAVQAFLLFLAAGIVFGFHDQRAHRLVPGASIDDSATGKIAAPTSTASRSSPRSL